MYSGIFLRENEFCGLVSVSENIFGKSIVMWHVDELDCGDGTVQSVLPPPNSGAANKAVKVIQHMDREDCLPLVASCSLVPRPLPLADKVLQQHHTCKSSCIHNSFESWAPAHRFRSHSISLMKA